MVHSLTDAPEESDLWTAWQLFPLDDDHTGHSKDSGSDTETDVFSVWRGRQIFCEFPLEWNFEIVIGEDILKQGFGYN